MSVRGLLLKALRILNPLRLLYFVAKWAVRLTAIVFAAVLLMVSCNARAAVDERGVEYVEKVRTVDWAFNAADKKRMEDYYSCTNRGSGGEWCPSSEGLQYREYSWSYSCSWRDISPNPTTGAPRQTLDRTHTKSGGCTPGEGTLSDRVNIEAEKTETSKCPSSHPNEHFSTGMCYATRCGANGGYQTEGLLFAAEYGVMNGQFSEGVKCPVNQGQTNQCEVNVKPFMKIRIGGASKEGWGGVSARGTYTGKTCGDVLAEQPTPDELKPTPDPTDANKQCVTNSNGKKVCYDSQNNQQCGYVNGTRICTSDAPAPSDPCKNGSGYSVCWSNKLPVDGQPAGQPDITGNDPLGNGSLNYYHGGSASGSALGGGAGSGETGGGGTGGGAGECAGVDCGGQGGGTCTGQNCGPGDWYEPKDKTVQQVLERFKSQVNQSGTYAAATQFFTVNVSGSCPQWTIPATQMTPSIPLGEIFCGSALSSVFPYIRAVIIASAAFLAFRWAFL